MRLEIRLDQAACMGSGLCTGIAPEHFAPTGDHRSVIRAAVVDRDDAVFDAAACCPAEAITVREAGTGRKVDG